MTATDDTPEPSASRRPSGVVISTRTLLFAGALAMGGTMTRLLPILCALCVAVVAWWLFSDEV